MPGVTHTLSIAGQSILMNANAPNFGAMYVMLDDFHTGPSMVLTGPVDASQVQDTLQNEIQDGLVNVFERPSGGWPGDRRRLQDRHRGSRATWGQRSSNPSPTTWWRQGMAIPG